MPHANDAGAAPVLPEPVAMWTRSDDKLLELLLLVPYFQRWDMIASRFVGKTLEQVYQRYERTVDEVTRILHAPEVETPREWDVQSAVAASPEAVAAPAAAATDAAASSEPGAAAATKRKRKAERKKPEKWTKEEHSLFLEYLEKHGPGKWKAMSTEYLTTKTAFQIASHHQKHCKRLEQRKLKLCKRASIHDITEPTRAAAVGGVGDPAVQKEDELGRGVGPAEPKAPGPGEPAAPDVEDFFGEYDDLGPFFMW